MITEIHPDFALSHYITKYSFLNLTEYYNSERCIPDGSIKFFIYENGTIEYHCINSQTKYTWGDGVGGHPLSTEYEMKVTNPAKFIICHFRPSGFFRLFGIPVYLLNDNVIPIEEIIYKQYSDLKNRLIEADTIFEKKVILDCFFKELIRSQKIKSLKDIDQVEHLILKNGGNIKIDNILHNSTLSLRSIERNFHKIIGLSPKYFCRVIRFNKTLLFLNKNMSWKDITFQNGYYDQSHYISEFRHFIGISPNKFKKETSINTLYIGKFLEDYLV